jgi:hypothetical protein
LAVIAIAIVWKQMTLEHWVLDVRDFPPARTPDLPAIRGRIPALLATPLWPPRPLGLLKQGNDVKYPAGTKVTVYTDQQITVKVAQ